MRLWREPAGAQPLRPTPVDNPQIRSDRRERDELEHQPSQHPRQKLQRKDGQPDERHKSDEPQRRCRDDRGAGRQGDESKDDQKHACDCARLPAKKDGHARRCDRDRAIVSGDDNLRQQIEQIDHGDPRDERNGEECREPPARGRGPREHTKYDAA